MTNILNLLIGPCAAIILTQIFLLSGGENFHQTFGYNLVFTGVLFLIIGLTKRLETTLIGGIICLGLSYFLLF